MISIDEITRSIDIIEMQLELSRDPIPKLTITTEPKRKRNDITQVVVALGSYDPLTIAHQRLLQNARSTVMKATKENTEIIIVTTTSHFDKQVNLAKNSLKSDRVHAQEIFAKEEPYTAIAMCNRPLFIDVIDAVRCTYEKINGIHFVMGTDVFAKLLPKESYVRNGMDPDQAIQRLAGASYVVMPRPIEGQLFTTSDIFDMHPHAQPLFSKVIEIPTPEISVAGCSFEDLSSSYIRSNIANGKRIDELMPPSIAAFVHDRHLYEGDHQLYRRFVDARIHAMLQANAHHEPIDIQSLLTQVRKIYEKTSE